MTQRRFGVFGLGVVGSMLLCLACGVARAQSVVTMQSESADAAEAHILRSLDTSVSFDFHEQPLQEVVEYFSSLTNLEIQMDIKALEDASIGADTPVTGALSSVTLRSALRSLLGALDLTYVIKNEVLLITTPEKAGNELITRVYLVRDLVVVRTGDRVFHNYAQLIDLITATIAPTTWDEVGGPGAIHEFRHSAALVVSTTREVHEQIEPLLEGLRQARDLQHMPYDSPAAPHRSQRSAPPERYESSEPGRYVVSPNAGWLVPRVHE
jgi:hypothetical protein